MKKMYLLFLFALFLGNAQAKDLGIYGKSYEITDVDIRLILMSQLSEVDWEDQGKKERENAENEMRNLAYSVKLPPVEKIKMFHVNMSTVVKKDITSPVRHADGSISSVTIAKKGDVIDPLKMMGTLPFEKFLFFDPEDPEQLNFAINLKNSVLKEKYFIKFLITGGDILDTAEKMDGVFYAYKNIVRRLKVTRNLSFVFVDHKNKKMVLIELPKNIKVEKINEILEYYFN